MKKGIAAETLIWILFITISFIVVASLLNFFFFSAEGKTAEAICRGSVAARERTMYDVKGVEVFSTPFLCKTSSINIPEKKAQKDEVKKEIAEKIAGCWWQFGEGMIRDVFRDRTMFGKEECFVCYNVNLKEWEGGNERPISSTDLLSYMANNVYKIKEDDDDCKMYGGYCLSEDECKQLNENGYFKIEEDSKCKKESKICCYSPYDCLNKGGECLSEPKENYLKYDKWNCPSGECYIKKENYWSYLEYIQGYGGNGRIVFSAYEIKPGESYAIAFGSPNSGEGRLDVWIKSGAVGGALAAVVVGVATGGTGLIALSVYAAGGALIGTLTGKAAGETEVSIRDLLSNREVSTVYFSTLNDMGDVCETQDK